MFLLERIYFFIIILVVYIRSETLPSPGVCDIPRLRQCYFQSFNLTLAVVKGNNAVCRSDSFTSYATCSYEFLEACRDSVGPVTSALLRPYIGLLDNIFSKACSKGLETVDCEFRAAEKCLLHFGEILSHGQLGPICRQAEVVLKCLEEPLDSCSGFPRYLVAMVTDEIKLTSDLVCHRSSCNLEVAGQCIHDAMETLDFPVAIGAQSPVVCSKVRNALACITNNTMECEPETVPESFVQHYLWLYQLSADNCGIVADNFMLMNIPAELIGPVYLAVMSRNPRTLVNQICQLYNSTIMTAAHYGDVITTYTDSLLTWQHSMEITIDMYSDVCFSHQKTVCDWLDRTTNSNPSCDATEAEQCLDVVFVSKMVAEAALQRESWQNICGHYYSMMNCASHYLVGCPDSEDTTAVTQLFRTVYQLVGAPCAQMGPVSQPESCDLQRPKCDFIKALEECGRVEGEACLSSEEVFSCFQRHTEACTSVAMALAQHQMEWLLLECPLNKTLVSYDILHGVSSCSLKLGYNLYNGLQVSSDFVGVLCAAEELYQICLSTESVPQMAQLYMQPGRDAMTLFQQKKCYNGTDETSLLFNFEENKNCNWSSISSQLTQSLMMLSSFPLLSVAQQEQICGSVSTLEKQLAFHITMCTPERQNILQQALLYLYEAYSQQCQPHRLQGQRACDTDKIQTCLENFGTFLNFASASEVTCSELHSTFQCIHDNIKDCDESVEVGLLREVRVIQTMMGNQSCPMMPWCDETVKQTTVVTQMCASPVTCSIDWSSCVAFTGFAYCLNLTETKDCIRQKLSGCDPLQYVMLKSSMVQNIKANSLPCDFVPDDPPGVLPVHYSINQCQQYISMTTDVTRLGLCNAIRQYIECVSVVDGSALPVVWKGILGRNAQMWQKRWYLDCHMADGEKFMVDYSFNDSAIFGDMCQSIQGQLCLRSLADISVSYVMLPLQERQYNLCEVTEDLLECVQSNVAGCTSSLERAMLTSAQWLSERISSLGICEPDAEIMRSCDPSATLLCISELGNTLITGSQKDRVACSQLLTTAVCVEEKTSSCDFNTRTDILSTFSMVSNVVQQTCTQEPEAESLGCLAPGDRTSCDLKEILTCMVPVRVKMLMPHTTSLAEVCGMIPAMKACIQRHSSGCDDGTLSIVSHQLTRLNVQLGNQCPQMYCEECKARQCVADLYQSLQYSYDDLCVLVAETRQCIYDNAQYCDRSVGEMLLHEMELLVGEQGQRCEVTLPACLRTLMISAFRIMDYNTDYVTMATNTSNNLAFMSICNEAASAYYCVSYHVTTMEGHRQWVMNETLREIGDLVSQTCQGPRLQCYSCVNATSNEECNSQPVKSCAPDMQACGTMVTDGYLSKGCVRSDTCQTGCYGDTCTLCCHDNMCNQPWNNIIVEPPSCQPRSALWCGFQLLNILAQNDTVDCSVLHETISCITSSTADCALHLSTSLSVHAHRLLASDVMSDCISQSSLCSCGQCTSLILLSVISNQYTQNEEFCSIAAQLYKQTQEEMSSEECGLSTLQSTIYNLNMAAYLAYGVCDIGEEERECYYNGEIYASGSGFNASDGCNTCHCNNGHVGCTLMYCPPDTSDVCPPLEAGTVGICVEECSSDDDCYMDLICCSNGCGHTCQRRYSPGDSECRYGNTTYKSGDSFQDLDGCNNCFCSNGIVGCTKMYCPPQDSQCKYNDRSYNSGESFNSTDGCNTCFCYHGYIGCTERACLPPAPEPCYYGNMTYSHDQMFLATDGCNLCKCSDGTASCTKMYCYNGNNMCYYGNRLYQSGDVFAAADVCNVCVCGNGLVGCTEIACPTIDAQCYYGNRLHNSGDTFPAADGCNTCFCSNGGIGCTYKLCPPSGNKTEPPICDVQGIHDCIEDATLPTLSALGMLGNAGHVCMSARNMLRCVHTKINTCPSNIMVLVRNALWWNLGFVQGLCDVQEIIDSYNNETRPNNTIPGNNTTEGECSINQALSCFVEVSATAPGVCSDVQSMIDCVENLISGCVSVARVPVLYELQHHLLPVREVCNVTLSSPESYDPLYPVSQCSEKFAEGIEEALSEMYFRRGNRYPVCDELDTYLTCLHAAQPYIPPVGNLYISNILMSLSEMIRECQVLRQEEELQSCHGCDWSANEEACDEQPSQKCQLNQICHTFMHHDVNTGVAMVTKGCADLTWCQTWYGCNPYTMSCVHCCYGDNCNAAINNTFTTPLRTTPQTMPPRPATTAPPTTVHCDVSGVSSHMVVAMLHLVNFHFLPMIEKQLFCMNFENNLAQLVRTLDPRCSNETRDRVHVMAEWLTNLRDEVCPDFDEETEAWERCGRSVRCLQGLGNFTDKAGACRSVKDSSSCLTSYYSQCPASAYGAINRTVQLLSYMDDLVCVNETLGGPEPQCVNVTANKPSAVCNMSTAMDCGIAIHRSLYSPFTTRDQFCSTMKRGMQCIQDNTFNCSSDVYQQVGLVVMEILHQSPDICPDLWCPVDDQCRLDKANGCLDDLEMSIQSVAMTGQIDTEICLNMSTVHNCVWNATERCHMSDTQQILQRYNQLMHYIYPYCQQQTIPTEVCLEQFQSTVHYLNDFDQLFTLKFTHAVMDFISLYISQALYGLGLPGAQGLQATYSNITLAGIALPGVQSMRSEMRLSDVLGTGADGWLNMFGLGLPGSQVNLIGIGLPEVQSLLQELGLSGMLRTNGIGLPDVQSLLSSFISSLGYDTSGNNVNMTELITMLVNQSYFGGNFQENLAEFGSQSNSSASSRSTSLQSEQGSRSPAGGFSSYSRRRKRSLSPSQNDRAGNKTTFWNDRNQTVANNNSNFSNGADDQTNRPYNNQPNSNNRTNSYQNLTNMNGTISNMPYLFNGTHFSNASTILSLLNLTLPDLNLFIDQSVYSIYGYNKMAACAKMQEAYSCLQNNLGSHLRLLEPQRGFILEKSLEGLMLNTGEHCQDLNCHSCFGLDDNEECNQQPVSTCPPLQVCQSRVVGDHISKGCASVWSCEQECRQSDGPCYCCHGNLCNEPELAYKETCDLRMAMNCTSSMLKHVMNHTAMDLSFIYDNAKCMMAATRGCHTKFQQDLHTVGDKILRSVAYSLESGSDACGLSPAWTDNMDVVDLYATSEVMCRMFNSSLESFLSPVQGPDCHSNLSSNQSSLHHDMLIFIFNRIHTVCPNKRAQLLYDSIKTCSSANRTEVGMGTNVTMVTDGTMGNSTTVATGNTTLQGNNRGQNETRMAEDRKGTVTCDINFLSNDGVHEPKCSVSEAVEQCLIVVFDETATNCSVTETENLLKCIHNYTRDCVSVQLLPITAGLVMYQEMCQRRNVSIPVRFDDMLEKDHLGSVSQCLYKFVSSSGRLDAGNQSTLQNVCHETDEVISCLATEKQHQLPIYFNFVTNIVDKIENLKEHVCSNESSSIITPCFTYYADEIKLHIIDTITTHWMSLEEIADVCRTREWIASSQDTFDGNSTTECTENHPGIQQWIEKEMEQLCSQKAVKDICTHPACDVAMATEMMSKMSYYFINTFFSDNVLCGKIESLLKSLECYLHECHETDMQAVKKELMYVRHIVHDRCPAATEILYCSASFKSYFEDQLHSDMHSTYVPTMQYNMTTLRLFNLTTPASTSVTFRPQPARNPISNVDRLRHVPSSGTFTTLRPSPVDRAGAPQTGTSQNRISCNSVQAQWCVFTVTLPTTEDENYCRALQDSMAKLALCVKDRIANCSAADVLSVQSFYSNMFREAEMHCGTNLTSRLVSPAGSQQCIVPICSFTGALHCLDYLHGNSTSCGNLQDIHQCVELYTEGCSALQAYPVMTIFKHLAMYLGIEEACWGDNSWDVEMSYSGGFVGCVKSFTESVAEMADSEQVRQFGVCEPFQSYMSCVSESLESPDIPVVMRNTLNHLILVAEPSLSTVCKEQDDKLTMGQQEDNESCDQETAMLCLNSYTTSILMSPTLTQEGKRWVCQNLGNGDLCLENSLSSCSPSTTRSLKTIYQLVKMMGQLSGVCSLHPLDCSPDLAVGCMSDLEETTKQKIHYGNTDRICRGIESADSCIKQTVGRCDKETQKSLLQLFEPIKWKAYSLCPMAIEDKIVTVEMPLSCVSQITIGQRRTCDPGQALYCLQDFHGDYGDSQLSRDKVCLSYTRSLQCYFDNLQSCDADVPVLLAHQYLLMTMEMVHGLCNTTIKTSCDLEQEAAGCDLHQVESCISEVERLHMAGYTDKDMCYALHSAESCIDLHAADCLQVTSLYTKSLFMKLISNKHLSDIDCDTAESCGWGYGQLLKSLLNQQLQYLMEKDLTNMTGHMKNAEVKSVCKRRHSSLECVRSYAFDLPDDVAMVINHTFDQLEDLFSYACGDKFSIQSCVSCTSSGCLGCYIQSVDHYLPPLLSFLNRGRDDLNQTFCSEPLNATDWYSSITETCYDGQDATNWNMFYAQSVEDLYRKYCLMPCNQSSADECLQNFQNQSVDASNEEVCRLYTEVQDCLNTSVSSCSEEVMMEYLGEADLIFDGTGVICYIMPTVAIESTDVIYLEEGGSAQYISVTLESVVGDSCHGNYCHLEIFISSNNSLLPSCLNGEPSPQFVTSSCSYIFSEGTSQISIPLIATLDHKNDLHSDTQVMIIARLWEDNVPVAMETVAEIPVSLVDVDTSGVCSGRGVYMTTFDGFFYGNFYKGEFVIYQHTEYQYAVHAAIQKCKGVGKCICAVMVQVDDDVYILDRCTRTGEKTHPLEFYAYVNNEMTEGLHVYRSDDGNSFQLVLPIGTIVTAESLELELIVSVKPSPHDRNSTRGLCGVFDYNVTNDLTQLDGSEFPLDNEELLVMRDSDYSIYRPKPFLKSWSTEETLFEGVAANDSLASPVTTTWCDCTNSSSQCHPYEIVQTCDFVEGEDITNNMEMYLRYPAAETRRRRHAELTRMYNRNKRQTMSTSNNIDWGDGDDEDLSNFAFPTASGITESMASTACQSSLVDSSLGQICETVVDTTSLVTACITDVMILDSVQDAVDTSVSSLQQQCRTAVVADPSIAVALNTTYDQLVPYLLNLTCQNGCNGQGTCEQGVCQCSSGYTGSDCSLSTSQAPTMGSVTQALFTADPTTANSVSTNTVVRGDHFINTPSLSCHQEMVELIGPGYNRTGILTTSQATFLTSQSVSCPVTGSLPLTVLLLSVSNNGVNQSSEIMYIIQDPVCYDCDPVSELCTVEPTSCVIDGSCYAAGAYNPADQCLICDPFSNQWKYKTTQTCPATTTSTTTVSMQSSTSTPSSSTPAVTTASDPSSVSATKPSTKQATDSTTESSVSTKVSSRPTKVSTSGPTKPSTSGRTPSVSTVSTTQSSGSSRSASSSSDPPSMSPTPTTTIAASSSTSSSSARSTTPAPTGATSPTSASSSTTKESEGGDQGSQDEQILIIVIAVAVALAVIVIIAIIIISFRLRRQDMCTPGRKIESPTDSTISTGQPDLQGRQNPAYGDIVYDNNGQPVTSRRNAPTRSAPFNPSGLGVQKIAVATRGSGAPDEEDGLHRVNVHMFEQPPDEGRTRGDYDYEIHRHSPPRRSPERHQQPPEPRADYDTRL